MTHLNKHDALALLGFNLTDIANKKWLCDNQISSVSSVGANNAELQGAAYQKCFRYLNEVKVPVLYRYLVF
jgi:hypothetical protein